MIPHTFKILPQKKNTIDCLECFDLQKNSLLVNSPSFIPSDCLAFLQTSLLHPVQSSFESCILFPLTLLVCFSIRVLQKKPISLHWKYLLQIRLPINTQPSHRLCCWYTPPLGYTSPLGFCRRSQSHFTESTYYKLGCHWTYLPSHRLCCWSLYAVR